MIDILNTNKEYFIGCDEVGTGSYAGPLVVAGVRAPRDWTLQGLNDSKKLSPKRRGVMGAKLEKLIADGFIAWEMAERSNTIIDQMGLGAALKDAYYEVFKQLYNDQSLIIIDGNLKFDNPEVETYNKICVIKADALFPQVMAASILAKVYRDTKMKVLHNQYPMYGWDHNVGYINSSHIDAVNKYGYCSLHRLSYKVKGVLSTNNLTLNYDPSEH
jgi:ribonuclease HII